MATIYFAGGEDSEFFSTGGAPLSTGAGNFRSSFARCSLTGGNSDTSFWTSLLPFVGNPSSFWFSARLRTSASTAGTLNNRMLKFLDAAGLARLQIRCSVGGTPPTFVVDKVNSAGSTTNLANTLSAWQFTASGNPDQIIVQWVNSVSGTINIYVNSGGTTTLVFNYSGDTTTETTTLSAVQLMCGFTNQVQWSEVIVADFDCRSLSLQTLAPVANGNTHNFDTGSPAAANVNETTLNDATLDGSTTAGQIDEYTIPAIASGTWAIIAVGVSARMQKGASGPSKMDLVLRSGSTDYPSADQVLTTSFAPYQNWWMTDPNTSAAWTGLPVNIGLKSVT